MNPLDERIEHLAEIYRSAEAVILAQINAVISSNWDGKNIATHLARIGELHNMTRAELARLDVKSKKWVSTAIPATYKGGVKEAQEQIKNTTGKVVAGFGGFHVEAIASMKDKTYSRLADVITTTGRKTLDIYNEAKLKTYMFEAMAGVESVEKVSGLNKLMQQMKDELEGKGIVGFVDRSGRTWSMARYTEMLARTTVMQARNEAKWNELRLRGHDLVKVTTHLTLCSLCKPWEGEILSISGESEKFPSIEKAKASGLFHPNCKHSTGLYIDITTTNA